MSIPSGMFRYHQKNYKMIVCYFGGYDKNYSRNKINIDGLQANGVRLIHCSIRKPTFRTESMVSIVLYCIKLPFHFVYRNLYLIYKGYQKFIKYRYDIILVGYPGHLDLPAAMVLRFIINKPILFDSLISIHDTFVTDREILRNKFLSRILYSFEKNLYKIPNYIFLDTKTHSDFVSKKYKIPSQKIGYLYIGALKGMNVYKKRHNNQAFKVVFYGYASPLHGIEYIIKAAKLCESLDIEFVFIGGGQTRKNDLALARKLNVKKVEFLPSLPENKALKIIYTADLMLGIFKGNKKANRVIPNKVYQGIALGIPVLTSQTDGIKEVFTNKKDILLCKPANEFSIASSIRLIFSDNLLRKKLSENGYELYLNNFTPQKTGHHLVKLLDQTVSHYNKIYAK